MGIGKLMTNDVAAFGDEPGAAIFVSVLFIKNWFRSRRHGVGCRG